MAQLAFSPENLEEKAAEVAGALRAVANPRRLMILCRLAETGEASPGALAQSVGLSQPALSQHLAKMRAEGLLAYRRQSQTLWYRIADPRIAQLLATLHDLYCAPSPRGRRRA